MNCSDKTKKETFSENPHGSLFTHLAMKSSYSKWLQNTDVQQMTPEKYSVGKYSVVEYEGSLIPGLETQIHCGYSVQVNGSHKIIT